MRRDEFRQLIREDRKAALTWLAKQTFDTYALEDLKTLWVNFHTGEVSLQPLSGWPEETLMEIADYGVNWDEEDEEEDDAEGGD